MDLYTYSAEVEKSITLRIHSRELKQLARAGA
jgi:hypothetical protein